MYKGTRSIKHIRLVPTTSTSLLIVLLANGACSAQHDDCQDKAKHFLQRMNHSNDDMLHYALSTVELLYTVRSTVVLYRDY